MVGFGGLGALGHFYSHVLREVLQGRSQVIGLGPPSGLRPRRALRLFAWRSLPFPLDALELAVGGFDLNLGQKHERLELHSSSGSRRESVQSDVQSHVPRCGQLTHRKPHDELGSEDVFTCKAICLRKEYTEYTLLKSGEFH